MTKEDKHVPLPRLYGAPPTARPAPIVKEAPRPFDPDEMPISADRSDDERSFAESLPPHAFLPGGGLILGGGEATGSDGGRRRRWLSLRGLPGLRRLFGNS